MTFKILNIADPGSSIQFGANDLDNVNRYLSGEDLGIGNDVTINTNTKYSSGKLSIADTSNNYKITVKTSTESANADLTIPPFNGVNQQMVTTAAGQTLTNKTLNATSNTVTGLTNTNIDTDAAIDWSKINKAFSSIGDFANTQISATPTLGDAILWNGSKWVNAAGGGGGGGGSGEINTASNVGTAGTGVYKQKSLYDLQFKKLNPGSSKLTITDDTANSRINIDVNLASALLSDFGGSVTSSQIGALAVGTTALADASVTLAKMAASSVDSSKIVDLSITNSDISNSASIGWPKISKTGSILADIGDVSIASAATNDLLTWNGSAWINSPSTAGLSPVTSPKWGVITGGALWFDYTATNTNYIGSGLCEHWKIWRSGTTSDIGYISDADGTAYSLLTGTIVNDGAGIDSISVPFRTAMNPKFWAKIKFTDISNLYWFLGFDTVMSMDPAGNALGGHDGVGFKYDPRTDAATGIKVVTNNGQTTQTSTTIGVVPVANTVYNLSLQITGGGATGYHINYSVNNTSGFVTTNNPGTNYMGFLFDTIGLSTTARSMYVYYLYFNIDK